MYLGRLDLSQYSIRTFDIGIHKLSEFTFLSFSYNLFSTIYSNITSELITVFKSTEPHAKLLIDLTDNPLQCSWTTFVFLQWISTNRDYFIHFSNYSCLWDKLYVIFSHLEGTILVERSYVCSQRIAVIVSAFLRAFFFFLIMTSICMHRYRWEVRYWCLWLTDRFRLCELNDETEDDHDAIVSYTGHDGDCIKNELMPHL